jgi:hypothetical protein
MENPQPPALPERHQWHLESIAAAVAGCIAVTYALGLVISNLFLDQLGATDFGDFRPRAILVGIAFLTYLGTPAFVAVVPILVLNASQHFRLHRIFGFVLAVASVGFIVNRLPYDLGHFIVAVPTVCTFREVSIRFWRETYATQWPYLLLLVVAPAMSLAAVACAGRRITKLRLRIAIAGIALGLATQIYPFADSIYPSIRSAVGGGHPQLAEVFFNNEVESVTTRRLRQGHFLVWHTSGDTIILTDPNIGPITRTYLVRSDEVLAMIRTDAHVYFRDGEVKHVIRHSTKAPETNMSFPSPPP